MYNINFTADYSADMEEPNGVPCDVISLMKETLPEYCFLAAGYDVPEVIASMDISTDKGNSIKKYISENFPGDPKISHYSDLPSIPFQFPPGHRIRICNFISLVKAKFKPPMQDSINNRKRKHFNSAKKAVTVSKKCKPLVPEVTILNQIRSNIVKWIKKQANEKLQNLEENKHFTINF